MIENKMYSDRRGNIPVHRGCDFLCTYCNFNKMLKMSSCPMCRDFTPHSHMEVLERAPPKTPAGTFNTVGLSGDISFMLRSEFIQVLDYCKRWSDRTFLIQSKAPAYFLNFLIPSNVIIGTTIETNRNDFSNVYYQRYVDISKAPHPVERIKAMVRIEARRAVTIEPIHDCDVELIALWMQELKPERIWIGYVNDRHDGKKLRLPEPSLAKTQELIELLERQNYNVQCKTMRKAWWEK